MAGKQLVPLSLILLAIPACAGKTETLDTFLREGRIEAGLSVYAARSDNEGLFSLALLQTLDGLQHFSAGFNQLGINPEFVRDGLPFFRVVLPRAGEHPGRAATPAEVAGQFRALRDSLRRANATLARMDEKEFGVEVNLSQIHLDLDGDGQCSPNETLAASLERVLAPNAPARGGGDMVVRFDSADAMWLKGYTHFLSGVLDLLLAYDWRPVWDQCAHVIFLKPEPLPPLARFLSAPGRSDHWADLIAALHNMRLDLVDKEGLAHAREEFRAMLSCSRLCWQRVLAEKDNDKEWLPSPRQTGPRGFKVTQAQVDAWMRVLDELEAVASGQKLLAHWRLKPGVGINVNKLIASPPPLDLVLLLQGSALVPYVEEGMVSDLDTWRRLTEPFGPGFPRFAIWSN